MHVATLFTPMSTGTLTCVWDFPLTHHPSVPNQAPGVKCCSFPVRCSEDSTMLDLEKMQNVFLLSTASVLSSLTFANSTEYVLPNLICALNGLNGQWMLLFQLTKREETASRCLLLYSREQLLNGCCVIPASSGEPGLEEKCRLWIQHRDTERWPLFLLNFPLKVFSLIAEKRGGLCFSEKKRGGFNLGNECFAMKPSSRASAKQGPAVY